MIRRLRRTRSFIANRLLGNLRVLREIMTRVMNLPRLQVDFMSGEIILPMENMYALGTIITLCRERGLDQGVISQLPVYKFKSPPADSTTASPESTKEAPPAKEGQTTLAVENTTKVAEKDDENKRICAICMDSYKPEDEVMILPCLHQFHNGCIQKWFNESKECPICKNEVKLDAGEWSEQ